MSLEQNLREMERSREAYWRCYPATSPVKLRWRARAVRHSFHVLPGESILELGAGSGLWTRHLSSVLRGENPITAAVFNVDLLTLASKREIPGARFLLIKNLAADLPEESFDYIVGTAIICHNLYPENLRAIYRLLKPGGQLLFFEANHWNPQVFIKNTVRPIGRWAGHATCQVGLRKYKLLRIASHQGFSHVDIIPYDIIHPRAPRWLISSLQSVAYIFEHMPVVKELCGTLCIWAKKPGARIAHRAQIDLASHPSLFGSTSVVLPCHNEEMNLPPLVEALIGLYGKYIHEIIVVNDNSSDRTAETALNLGRKDPRIKLVNRDSPNGVGLALRDGYAAATGRFILTMDCDFVQIVPELRDVFDAIASGRHGAIGSRFSHDSIMINYPFMKIVANRAFHLLANLVLPCRVRDSSNNLKLMRAEILKSLQIQASDFAANAETGLRPILMGYDLEEVPMSWINRTSEMGSSSFRLLQVARSYSGVLWRLIRQKKEDRTSPIQPAVRSTTTHPSIGEANEDLVGASPCEVPRSGTDGP